MTRKDYNAVATSFGFSMRLTDETTGAWQMVDAFAQVAARDNARFDIDRFFDWVRETYQGTRDIDGKKV